MIQDITFLPPPPSVKPQPAATAAPATLADPAGTPAPKAADVNLLDTVRRAASQMFPDRGLSVSTFHDDASGRMVIRVADERSGELIAQMPPEDLLRFYAASATEAQPLLTVRA